MHLFYKLTCEVNIHVRSLGEIFKAEVNIQQVCTKLFEKLPGDVIISVGSYDKIFLET